MSSHVAASRDDDPEKEIARIRDEKEKLQRELLSLREYEMTATRSHASRGSRHASPASSSAYRHNRPPSQDDMVPTRDWNSPYSTSYSGGARSLSASQNASPYSPYGNGGLGSSRPQAPKSSHWSPGQQSISGHSISNSLSASAIHPVNMSSRSFGNPQALEAEVARLKQELSMMEQEEENMRQRRQYTEQEALMSNTALHMRRLNDEEEQIMEARHTLRTRSPMRHQSPPRAAIGSGGYRAPSTMSPPIAASGGNRSRTSPSRSRGSGGKVPVSLYAESLNSPMRILETEGMTHDQLHSYIEDLKRQSAFLSSDISDLERREQILNLGRANLDFESDTLAGFEEEADFYRTRSSGYSPSSRHISPSSFRHHSQFASEYPLRYDAFEGSPTRLSPRELESELEADPKSLIERMRREKERIENELRMLPQKEASRWEAFDRQRDIRRSASDRSHGRSFVQQDQWRYGEEEFAAGDGQSWTNNHSPYSSVISDLQSAITAVRQQRGRPSGGSSVSSARGEPLSGRSFARETSPARDRTPRAGNYLDASSDHARVQLALSPPPPMSPLVQREIDAYRKQHQTAEMEDQIGGMSTEQQIRLLEQQIKQKQEEERLERSQHLLLLRQREEEEEAYKKQIELEQKHRQQLEWLEQQQNAEHSRMAEERRAALERELQLAEQQRKAAEDARRAEEQKLDEEMQRRQSDSLRRQPEEHVQQQHGRASSGADRSSSLPPSPFPASLNATRHAPPSLSPALASPSIPEVFVPVQPPFSPDSSQMRSAGTSSYAPAIQPPPLSSASVAVEQRPSPAMSVAAQLASSPSVVTSPGGLASPAKRSAAQKLLQSMTLSAAGAASPAQAASPSQSVLSLPPSPPPLLPLAPIQRSQSPAVQQAAESVAGQERQPSPHVQHSAPSPQFVPSSESPPVVQQHQFATPSPSPVALSGQQPSTSSPIPMPSHGQASGRSPTPKSGVSSARRSPHAGWSSAPVPEYAQQQQEQEQRVQPFVESASSAPQSPVLSGSVLPSVQNYSHPTSVVVPPLALERMNEVASRTAPMPIPGPPQAAQPQALEASRTSPVMPVSGKTSNEPENIDIPEEIADSFSLYRVDQMRPEEFQFDTAVSSIALIHRRPEAEVRKMAVRYQYLVRQREEENARLTAAAYEEQHHSTHVECHPLLVQAYGQYNVENLSRDGPEYAWVLSTMSGMTSLPHDEIERQFDSLRRSPGGSQTNEREPLDDLQLPHGIREAFDAHSLSVVHADSIEFSQAVANTATHLQIPPEEVRSHFVTLQSRTPLLVDPRILAGYRAYNAGLLDPMSVEYAEMCDKITAYDLPLRHVQDGLMMIRQRMAAKELDARFVNAFFENGLMDVDPSGIEYDQVAERLASSTGVGHEDVRDELLEMRRRHDLNVHAGGEAMNSHAGDFDREISMDSSTFDVFLRAGSLLKKVARNHKLMIRHVRLVGTLDSPKLAWATSSTAKPSKLFPVKQMTSVEHGASSPIFSTFFAKASNAEKEQVDPDLCFTIHMENDQERSLDFVGSDAHSVDMWVRGLNFTIDSVKRGEHSSGPSPLPPPETLSLQPSRHRNRASTIAVMPSSLMQQLPVETSSQHLTAPHEGDNAQPPWLSASQQPRASPSPSSLPPSANNSARGTGGGGGRSPTPGSIVGGGGGGGISPVPRLTPPSTTPPLHAQGAQSQVFVPPLLQLPVRPKTEYDLASTSTGHVDGMRSTGSARSASMGYAPPALYYSPNTQPQ